MGRQRHDFDRIKRESSLLGLLPAGTKVHRVNDHHWRVQCPLHGGKRLSMGVWYGAHGWSFTCFGCNEQGTVIDFAMKLHGIGFKEAVDKLGGGTLEAPPPGMWQPKKKTHVIACEGRGCGRLIEVDIADVPFLGHGLANAWEFRREYSMKGEIVGIDGRCPRCVRRYETLVQCKSSGTEGTPATPGAMPVGARLPGSRAPQDAEGAADIGGMSPVHKHAATHRPISIRSV